MLVLSRKIGEEILIPEYGVALQVVAIQGSRVRIGIAAPANVRICREELLRPPEGTGPVPGHADELGEGRELPPGVGCDGKPMPVPERSDFATQLVRWVTQRTCGRVRSLSVRAEGSRLILEGVTSTYYARQVAEAAAQEFVKTTDGAWPGEFEFHIQVADGKPGRGPAASPDEYELAQKNVVQDGDFTAPQTPVGRGGVVFDPE